MEGMPISKSLFFKSTGVEIHPEDFVQLKATFPILKTLNDSNENFIKLAHYLKEMAGIKYDSAYKYQLMYKMVRIGSLFEALFPNIKILSPAEKVAECKDGSSVQDLSDIIHQYALFQVARNCAADFSHVFYEGDTRELVENFSLLCRGRCNSKFWVEKNAFGNTATDGKKLKAYFSEGGERGRKRINKLFCQMGYFLIKAKELLERKDYDGVCLALVAAGSCGRNFNRSTLNPVKVDSITADLSNIRATFTHVFGQSYDEKTFIGNLEKTNINGLIKKLVEEAESCRNPINLEEYYKKREADESPRAYDKDRFVKK